MCDGNEEGQELVVHVLHGKKHVDVAQMGQNRPSLKCQGVFP